MTAVMRLADARLKARYRAVIDSATDGFFEIGLDGRITAVNDAYCRMTGYPRSELVGMSVLQIDAVETPQEVARRIGRVAELGSSRFESRHRRKDGRCFDV